MDVKLSELLEAARQRKMSPQEEEAQRINFAYGNSPEEDKRCTIDSVKAAAEYLSRTKSSE